AGCRNVRSILGMVSAIVLTNAQPAWSQQPGAAPAVQQILLPRIQPAAVLEKYLEYLRNDFFNVDADSDGQITQRDVDLHTLMEGIQARTQALNMVMRYDLDGDGFVTEEEIPRGMSYDMRSQLGLAAYNKVNKPQLPAADFATKHIDNMVRTILALDSDRDGKISVAEAGRYNATGRGQNGPAARARQFLSLDGSSKGTLTLAEFQA